MTPRDYAKMLTRQIDVGRDTTEEIERIYDGALDNVPPPFGTLAGRLQWANENLKPRPTDKRVAFQPDPSKPAQIMHPAPRWMAAAMHGNILPPVEAYLYADLPQLQDLLKPLPRMTEDQAIEYLIVKDFVAKYPEAFAGGSVNRRVLAVTTEDRLPTDFRNAWGLTPA